MGLLDSGLRPYCIKCRGDMSYIREALLKAQREKDTTYPKYQRVFFSRSHKSGMLSTRLIWLVSVFVISVAFAVYSWLSAGAERRGPAIKTSLSQASSKPKPSVHAEDYYERARHFHKVSRLEHARMSYQKALMLDPGHVCALNNLGVLYIQQGNYVDAQRSLEDAIQQKPEYVDPYYNLACLYALKGEVTKSLSQLKKAVTLKESVREWARNDRDLRSLRGIPGFEEILQGEGMK